MKLGFFKQRFFQNMPHLWTSQQNNQKNLCTCLNMFGFGLGSRQCCLDHCTLTWYVTSIFRYRQSIGPKGNLQHDSQWSESRYHGIIVQSNTFRWYQTWESITTDQWKSYFTNYIPAHSDVDKNSLHKSRLLKQFLSIKYMDLQIKVSFVRWRQENMVARLVDQMLMVPSCRSEYVDKDRIV